MPSNRQSQLVAQLVGDQMTSRPKRQAFSHKLPERLEVGAVFIIHKCYQNIKVLPGLAEITGNKSEWQLALSGVQTIL